MSDEIRLRAYAKVNFGLNVLPKREDGFHNIESIFQTVDLSDELIVSKQNKKICSVHCSSLLLPLENTLTLAFKAFTEVTGFCDFGINVELIKGIPSGGGLGGGSSDAATLIRCMEKFYGIRLSDEQLSLVASKVGSDVFFFTRCNGNGMGCALVSGRGEVVEPFTGRKDLYIVLVFPKASSSTKLAYSLIDESYTNGKIIKGPSLDQLKSVYRKYPSEWNFVNTFTPVVSETYSEISQALKDVRKSGALFSDVSGSGSTVYGVFLDEQQAVYSNNLLAGNWYSSLVKTL